jgi:hypothetical protein
MKATEDEAIFPPQCCRTPIPSDLYIPLMTDHEAREFESKSKEFTTKDRFYCSAPACSIFLGERSMGASLKAVTCPSCSARTCDTCGHAAHAWHVPCSDRLDPDERALLEMGKRARWQQCPACRRIVERTEGCPHMRCLCGAEFCYRCGGVYHSGLCSRPTSMDQSVVLLPPITLPPPVSRRPRLRARRRRFFGAFVVWN